MDNVRTTWSHGANEATSTNSTPPRVGQADGAIASDADLRHALYHHGSQHGADLELIRQILVTRPHHRDLEEQLVHALGTRHAAEAAEAMAELPQKTAINFVWAGGHPHKSFP
jgi:hypothetical protein